MSQTCQQQKWQAGPMSRSGLKENRLEAVFRAKVEAIHSML
jgi:hypothetical protein